MKHRQNHPHITKYIPQLQMHRGGTASSVATWSHPDLSDRHEWCTLMYIQILVLDDHGVSDFKVERNLVIHSFSILSDDRSKASSKTMPPHRAI